MYSNSSILHVAYGFPNVLFELSFILFEMQML